MAKIRERRYQSKSPLTQYFPTVYVIQENNIKMKEYSTNDAPLPSANEPEAAYARLSPEQHAVVNMQAEMKRKGRMTVDEFCNMLHHYVDEYYDSVQG